MYTDLFFLLLISLVVGVIALVLLGGRGSLWGLTHCGENDGRNDGWKGGSDKG